MTSNETMTMMTIDLAQHLSSFSHVFSPSIGGHRLLLSLCTRLYKRTHGTYSLSHHHQHVHRHYALRCVEFHTRYTPAPQMSHTYVNTRRTCVHKQKLFQSNVLGSQAFASSRFSRDSRRTRRSLSR